LHPAELVRRERVQVGRLGTVRVVVGQDEIDVAAEAQRPVDLEAAPGGQVVRLEAEAELVELLDRHVLHVRGDEAVERRIAGPLDACRLELEPGLIRRHLLRPRRSGLAAEHLLALPALPRELVVVPHAHERPARGHLEDPDPQEGAVGGAVVLERDRHVQVADQLPLRKAIDVAQLAARSGPPAFPRGTRPPRR
jgi:hypothetical protein